MFEPNQVVYYMAEGGIGYRTVKVIEDRGEYTKVTPIFEDGFTIPYLVETRRLLTQPPKMQDVLPFS